MKQSPLFCLVFVLLVIVVVLLAVVFMTIHDLSEHFARHDHVDLTLGAMSQHLYALRVSFNNLLRIITPTG